MSSKVSDSTRKKLRKLKFSQFWNTKRSKQCMIKNCREIFGDSNNAVIGIGDREQKKHRKFKEYIKGNVFRMFFQNYGFKIYLIDEFRISCKCSHCPNEAGEFEPLWMRLDPNKED